MSQKVWDAILSDPRMGQMEHEFLLREIAFVGLKKAFRQSEDSEGAEWVMVEKRVWNAIDGAIDFLRSKCNQMSRVVHSTGKDIEAP